MRVKSGLLAAALLGLMIDAPAGVSAQEPPQTTAPPAGGRGAAGGRRPGGFVPGQQRPPGDPAQIARGKTLYGISCTGCHGADLRGGDMGGPEPAALPGRAERPGRRTDRSHHPGQPSELRACRPSP